MPDTPPDGATATLCSTATQTLVARGVCTLPESVDAYVWEIGVPKAERMALLASMTICRKCGCALSIRGTCEDACGTG